MANGSNDTLTSKIGTAVIGAAGGVLVTYVTAVAGHSEDIARITERLNSIQKNIESNMDDRYRGSDAVRDLAFQF